MQIEADQSVCPACGADGLELFPVFHHMICAYIGPEYDFAPAVAGYTCPKCRRGNDDRGRRQCSLVRRKACPSTPMQKARDRQRVVTGAASAGHSTRAKAGIQTSCSARTICAAVYAESTSVNASNAIVKTSQPA
jgi:hypothetical protein